MYCCYIGCAPQGLLQSMFCTCQISFLNIQGPKVAQGRCKGGIEGHRSFQSSALFTLELELGTGGG